MIKATLTQPPVNTAAPRFPFLVIERKTNAIWITISFTEWHGDKTTFGLSPISGEDGFRQEHVEFLLSGTGDFRLPSPGEKITIEY